MKKEMSNSTCWSIQNYIVSSLIRRYEAIFCLVCKAGGDDECLLWFTFHKTFGFHDGCLPWTEPPLP